LTTFALGAAILATILALAVPSQAAAAPHHNQGLTIRAAPDPIAAGEGVLIYGRLKGPGSADRRIVLFHRINPAPYFTQISVTRTNAAGFYEFVRADGVVVSNRNWFVRGPGRTHSRTIHERVSAVVTLNANSATATTAQTVGLSGNVYPTHRHERVVLQQQNSSSGNGWQTIATGYTNGASSFAIGHRFRSPGSYTLRAYFPGDPRNIPGQSPTVTLTVQQQQNPSFTISGSAAVITNGQTETISGTLYAAGSTTTPQPTVPVTLYGKQAYGGFKALESGMTDSSGNYSFTQMPLHNMVYSVRTASGMHEQTAALYVGVQDVVTIGLSPSTIPVGDSVTVSGVVTPQHTGHVIHLQEQNAAGNWVDLESGYASPSSTYSLSYTPGQISVMQLRVEITGGPINVGSVSNTQTLTVSGVAPVSTLPPAS
jgi:phage protein U